MFKLNSTTEQPCLLGRACDAVATGNQSQTFRKQAFPKLKFRATIKPSDAIFWATNVDIILFCVTWPDSSSRSPLTGFRCHTQTHHTREDSSLRVISPTRSALPDNTKHSQQTDIHASAGIRTRNTSKPAAVAPRLRPRDHWDRHLDIRHSQLVCCYCDIPSYLINIFSSVFLLLPHLFLIFSSSSSSFIVSSYQYRGGQTNEPRQTRALL